MQREKIKEDTLNKEKNFIEKTNSCQLVSDLEHLHDHTGAFNNNAPGCYRNTNV